MAVVGLTGYGRTTFIKRLAFELWGGGRRTSLLKGVAVELETGSNLFPGKYDELARRFRAVYVVPLTRGAAEALRRTALPKGVHVAPLRELGRLLKRDAPRAHMRPTGGSQDLPSGSQA